MATYIVASSKSWNLDVFSKVRGSLPGKWLVVTNPRDLNVDLLRTCKPRYVFFMHWSWIVPHEILNIVECVCFHMTDVPYGRGGSPLQNLIARGHRETKLSALRMTTELDAGPVYVKARLGLEGSATEIFYRSAALSVELMRQIVKEEPIPVEQAGDVVVFQRRTPDQSALLKHGKIDGLYDHIRMLDAETYPRAFVDHGDFRIEFCNARLDSNGERIEATARIVLRTSNSTELGH